MIHLPNFLFDAISRNTVPMVIHHLEDADE